MTNININDNRENPIQTLLSVFFIILFGIILFGLVPGFFLASIIDIFIPLETTSIWGISIGTSAFIIYLLYKKINNIRSAMLQYIKYSAILFILLITFGLILRDNIFFTYTIKKMFQTEGYKSFLILEKARGRSTVKTISLEEINNLYNLEFDKKEIRLFDLGFIVEPVIYNLNCYKRVEDNFIEYIYIEKKLNNISYSTNNELSYNMIKKSFLEDGYLFLEEYEKEGDIWRKYRKDNSTIYTNIDFERETPFIIQIEPNGASSE